MAPIAERLACRMLAVELTGPAGHAIRPEPMIDGRAMPQQITDSSGQRLRRPLGGQAIPTS